MKTALFWASVASLLLIGGCGRSSFREANLSAPAVTGSAGNETVWWAEHRASNRGPNAVWIIMCQRGANPPCVRLRPREVPQQ